MSQRYELGTVARRAAKVALITTAAIFLAGLGIPALTDNDGSSGEELPMLSPNGSEVLVQFVLAPLVLFVVMFAIAGFVIRRRAAAQG